jgi:hypothetical protein
MRCQDPEGAKDCGRRGAGRGVTALEHANGAHATVCQYDVGDCLFADACLADFLALLVRGVYA